MNPNNPQPNSSLPPEDYDMFRRQFICAKCWNRFTTQEDASIHYAIFHDHQPKASDIMARLEKVEDLVEQILITVSRDGGTPITKGVSAPPPKT